MVALIVDVAPGPNTFPLSSPAWSYVKFDCAVRMFILVMSTLMLRPALSSLLQLTILLQVFTSVPLVTLAHTYGHVIIAQLLDALLLSLYTASYLAYLTSIVSNRYAHVWPVAVFMTCVSIFCALIELNLISFGFDLDFTILYIIFCITILIFLARLASLFYYKIKLSDQSELFVYMLHLYAILCLVTLTILFIDGFSLLTTLFPSTFHFGPILRLLYALTLALFSFVLSPVAKTQSTELELSLISDTAT